MSVAAARLTGRAAQPVSRATGRPAGYLRLVVTRRSHAARAPFVVTVVVILAAGLLALLLLNTVLAQDAFRLHALQIQGRVLADQEEGLQRNVERLQSPQSLAARAGALGMVPGGPPAFLRLSDGKVLGAAIPGAVAPPPPVAAATPARTTAVATRPAAPSAGTWVPVPPVRGHAARRTAQPAGTWTKAPPPATRTHR